MFFGFQLTHLLLSFLRYFSKKIKEIKEKRKETETKTKGKIEKEIKKKSKKTKKNHRKNKNQKIKEKRRKNFPLMLLIFFFKTETENQVSDWIFGFQSQVALHSAQIAKQFELLDPSKYEKLSKW